ncbi:MAG: hypothetical protein PUI59_03235 [bacterium]|nr:hypothetical protein [bacterium]
MEKKKNYTVRIVLFVLLMIFSIAMGVFSFPVFFAGVALALGSINFEEGTPEYIAQQTKANAVSSLSIVMMVLAVVLFVLSLVFIIINARKKRLEA